MPPPLRMTRARGVVLASGLPVVAGLIGWSAFSAVAMADQAGFRVHLNVPATRQSRISVGGADAVLRPGSGRRIWVSGTLRGSLARPAFRWRSNRKGLALDAQCWSVTGFCTRAFTITAPAAQPLTVTGGSGDVNVNVGGFRGPVTLSASSGNVTASRLSGGSVRLTDSSGDINVTGLAGTRVTASDGSGNITLTFTKVPQQVNVVDGSGDITLVLPRGPAAYQVNERSDSGASNVSVRQVKAGQTSRYVINATDGSGDITIR